MPNSDTWDRSVYPYLTLMSDSFISCFLRVKLAVQPGLCLIWQETSKTGFLVKEFFHMLYLNFMSVSVDLLGLLKWQEILNDTTSLKKHLENLMKVQGEEIVKVPQVVDAISFYMLNTLNP